MSYLGAVRGYLGQRGELARQRVALQSMIAERHTIEGRLAQLTNPAVVEARARELGYVMPGEQPLRVTGLDAPPAAAPARRDGGGIWSWLPELF